MMLGTLAGSALARPPRVNDPRFGKSTSRVPFVVRFDLNDQRSAPCGVGKLAKERYFEEFPPFTCNVVFSCGPIKNGVGKYSNPGSIWSNVFFGAWEIVAKRSHWEEPFGYDHQRPRLDHILRLGLADWNLFSAYIFGSALPEESADMNAVLNSELVYLDRFAIPGIDREWDLVEGHNIQVPSPTATEHRGLWTPIWHFAFGRPTDATRTTSRMRIKLLMCHNHSNKNWRTWVCGAVVNEASTEPSLAAEFLSVQFASILEFVRNRLPKLGFLSPRQVSG